MHLNHMDIEKNLLPHESIYEVNMNTNIQEMIKKAPHALISRQHNVRTKQCHMGYQEGHLSEQTSFQLITSTIFVL